MRQTGWFTWVVIVGLGIVSVGCASWRGYGYDNTHFARQPNETSLNASTDATLHVDWDFAVPGGSSFTASPSVYGNTVYIGALNGVFYAIYASGTDKGTIRWRYPPASAPSPPDSCGTTTAPLLIATGSGNPSGPGIASSAAIVDNVGGHTAVIFGAPDPNSNAGDGRLWALDVSTGQCVWKSDVLAPTGSTSKIGYSSPAIAHGRAYIGVSAKRPDAPITIGKLFAVDLTNGAVDAAFNFSAMGSPAGGGIWSSPAVTPSGNIVVTTGNSCNGSIPDCSGAIPSIDFSLSMVKLDWQNGNVLWQLQPVDVHHDHDPDWAASPVVGQVSCGSLAISVQKDGYLHAADIKTGGPFSNPGCSYPGHSLECPRWTFPTVPSLPFEDDGHGDNMDNFGNRLIHPGALDGDHLFIATGGLNLTELSPTAAGRIVANRLYSLNVCAADADRIRWILDLNGAVGAPSVANGVIYTGTSTGHFYAIADTDVLPPSGSVCSYPNVPAGFTCSSGGFRNVPVPTIVKELVLTGAVPGVAAIANGQIFVATTSGHLYALTK